MDEHLNFENMEMYIEYECIKYTPIFAKCGLYYVIRVRKVIESNEKTMIITDGCIFDKLDKFTLEFTKCKFSFMKIEAHSLNNNVIDVITIVGDHDSVILV